MRKLALLWPICLGLGCAALPRQAEPAGAAVPGGVGTGPGWGAEAGRGPAGVVPVRGVEPAGPAAAGPPQPESRSRPGRAVGPDARRARGIEPRLGPGEFRPVTKLP